MFGGTGIYGYLNKDDKTTYKKESFVLFMTAMGASLDYLWYTQAQKYQDQGESKSKAYGKGALVTYGVFFVVGMIVLILAGNN